MSENVSRETFHEEEVRRKQSFKDANDIIDIHDPVAIGEPVLPTGTELIKTPEGICSMVGSFRQELEPLFQKRK